ncbi:hypothetical protein H9X75_05885 [Fusobacterium mortiferum]|uniref:hypothetical protein n=2 Tax=Fusobacterium mortiferum TaxID=850 RepID=UPI0019590990|nr:hypothetical protein [Fusobacterium mortiferum]
MVVSEEDNPNNTTTVETEKGIIDSQKLEINLIDTEEIHSSKIENTPEEIEESIKNIIEDNILTNEEDITSSENKECREINNEVLNSETLKENEILNEDSIQLTESTALENVDNYTISDNFENNPENITELESSETNEIELIENIENNIEILNINSVITDNNVDESLAEIPSSQNINENIQEENVLEIVESYSPKNIEIPFENGIETGLEISYTSLKLKDFPIKDSNLPYREESIENISLNSSNIHIGDTILSNVNIRILGYNKFKLIEFKTREFKIALSIALFDGNTIRKHEDYFTYEIFSKLKNSRVHAVAEILKSIFSGEKITFQIKDLFGDIQFENPIQAHKFNMIIESINKYEESMKLMNITKIKNFSESSLQFYTLHLLHNYLNNNTVLNSWINFRIENRFNVNIGDSIAFTKIHNLNIRGFNYDLKEIAFVKSALTEKEVNLEKNIVSGYRKIVDIKLELIEKQF